MTVRTSGSGNLWKFVSDEQMDKVLEEKAIELTGSCHTFPSVGPRACRGSPDNSHDRPHTAVAARDPHWVAIGAEIPRGAPTPIRTVRVRAAMVGGVDLRPAPARHDDAWGRSGGGGRGAVACAQVSQGSFLMKPAKGFGARLRFGRGGGGAKGVGHAAAESLGHTHWSMTHSQTRAISASW